MLSVRVTGPRTAIQQVVPRLRERPSVCDLVLIPGVVLDGEGDLLEFDLAREDANSVTALLEESGLKETGSVVLLNPLTVVSDAADAAEQAVPGNPDDGVVWDQIVAAARESARPSVSFYVFLVLATLIAGVGRLQDQLVLIVGAMVVGPEFAPISALCLALAFGRLGIGLRSVLTLVTGFAGAVLISWAAWGLCALAGWITPAQATDGVATAFIVKPDGWSFLIALLAGVAGVLSLTSSKSGALVGVFISVTTVPAVAVTGLALAVGDLAQALGALWQLSINVIGLLLAGTATLLVLRSLGPHLAPWLVKARFRADVPARPRP